MLNYLPLEYADLHIFTLIAMSIKGVNVKRVLSASLSNST